MIITNIILDPYELKLSNPIINSRNKYFLKKGYLVKIKSNEYNGYGEVAPLDFFSTETIEDIYICYKNFINAINLNTDIPLKNILNLIMKYCKTAPSLIFGLETALYDIKSREKNISLSKYFNLDSSNTVHFSSYYNSNNISNSNRIKIKIGKGSIEDEILKIKSIINDSSNSVKIRLDANRAYDLSDLLLINQSINKNYIDYIEEPFKDPTLDKYKYIQEHTSLNLGIDETIYLNHNYINFINKKYIDVLVIKPSIYGSYSNFFKLCNIAKKNNIRIILSSSLEGIVGNMATIHLAACINNNEKHGLNIHSFYNTNVDIDNYNIKENKVIVKNTIGLGVIE